MTSGLKKKEKKLEKQLMKNVKKYNYIYTNIMVEDAYLFNSIMDKYTNKFNINELYTPFLVIMIIWYLLSIKENKSINICTNCSQVIPPTNFQHFQHSQQLYLPQQFNKKFHNLEYELY